MTGGRSSAELIEAWQALGHTRRVGDDDVFVVDVEATSPGGAPPLLVIHGFPTSSIDFIEVLPALRAERRVVLVDLPGYGLSSKADRAYSMFGQADAVEQLVTAIGLDRVDLLTHDMGDTVGGELLARSIDGTLGFEVRQRVVTNGSIYIEMAHLTDGQLLLSSLPDEKLPEGVGADADGMVRALLDTMAPPGPDGSAGSAGSGGAAVSAPDHEHVRAASELIVRDGGNRLMPRLIRYLDERRQHEHRFTGAIEKHPSPLTIVWGDLDPIAVWPMTDQLVERRPDARRTRLEGVGHYPMVEAPAAFAAAVLAGL